jgi:hypothetical protein
MWTRLGFAKERRPARRAESPVHSIATIRHTGVVAGRACHRKCRCMEAGVDRSTAGADILAIPAPAHARDNRGRGAFPSNCSTEASTCYRHGVLQTGRRRPLTAHRTSKRVRAGSHAQIHSAPRCRSSRCGSRVETRFRYSTTGPKRTSARKTRSLSVALFRAPEHESLRSAVMRSAP